MPKVAANPIEYAKKTVSQALKSLDRVKGLARYSELTDVHRKQISQALREKLLQVDDAYDSGHVEEFSFFESDEQTDSIGE